jgi:hypothetical protein
MITKTKILERITPELIIDSMPPNHYFVFGSNEGGRHGKGAAKTAMSFGAKYGQSFGEQGATFAIPTVNAKINNKLKVEKIKKYVDKFIQHAKENPTKIYYVTPIGCGLAGHNVKDMAPLFKECIDLKNVYLPRVFWRNLIKF